VAWFRAWSVDSVARNYPTRWRDVKPVCAQYDFEALGVNCDIAKWADYRDNLKVGCTVGTDRRQGKW